MGKLLELGKQLDEITPHRSQFRKIDSTEDFPPEEMDLSLAWKPTQRDAWIEEFLFIRSKVGEPGLIRLNPVQREYARVCLAEKSHKNIVLKARQVGITTYIAARFFVQTITRPGTLTMQVAHDRESAEEIFRIVTPVLGQPAGPNTEGAAEDIALERAGAGVSGAGQRVHGGGGG